MRVLAKKQKKMVPVSASDLEDTSIARSRLNSRREILGLEKRLNLELKNTRQFMKEFQITLKIAFRTTEAM